MLKIHHGLIDKMPYANFFEAKKLDSQACNIYAPLAIFRPFFLLSGRSIGDFFFKSLACHA